MVLFSSILKEDIINEKLQKLTMIQNKQKQVDKKKTKLKSEIRSHLESFLYD